MDLLSMMDSLLRHRDSFYAMAKEGTDLKAQCGRLFVILVLTSGLYGASMGCFRWIHPEYLFSDFELAGSPPDQARGKVAGMNAEAGKIYTKQPLPSKVADSDIRFNVTRPTEPYRVASTGVEKGYGVIELAPASELKEPGAWKLPLLAALKTPLLLILTLLVCFLAMYVMNLAFGVGLHPGSALALMVFALAAMGTMLGVFIPIVILFSVVTESYHFIKVLHVLVFAIAGLFGVRVLYEGLAKLAPEGDKGVVASLFRGMKLKTLLLSWLLLYCLVGAQLAWTLKPFLGTPYLPATPPFRLESGNIYVSFFQSLSQLAR